MCVLRDSQDGAHVSQLDHELEEEMDALQEFHRTYRVEEPVRNQGGQSKRGSFYEALFNTAVGWTINYIANLVVLPWFGFNVTLSQAFWIGIIFTGISIARSYILRRIFNRWKAPWNREEEYVV